MNAGTLLLALINGCTDCLLGITVIYNEIIKCTLGGCGSVHLSGLLAAQDAELVAGRSLTWAWVGDLHQLNCQLKRININAGHDNDDNEPAAGQCTYASNNKAADTEREREREKNRQ